MSRRNVLIYLICAFLISHELDVVVQSEWRLLYMLRDLPDDQGQFWFVALHVPLFAMLLGLLQHPSVRVRRQSELGLAIFAVIHAGLHYRLSSDPLYTFHSPLSQVLIYGASLLGLYFLYLSRHKLLEPSSRQ